MNKNKWVIEYGNDTGPNDEGFWEWWEVTNGEMGFKCHTEKDANFLLAAITENTSLKERIKVLEDALKGIEMFGLDDLLILDSGDRKEWDEVWNKCKEALNQK